LYTVKEYHEKMKAMKMMGEIEKNNEEGKGRAQRHDYRKKKRLRCEWLSAAGR